MITGEWVINVTLPFSLVCARVRAPCICEGRSEEKLRRAAAKKSQKREIFALESSLCAQYHGWYKNILVYLLLTHFNLKPHQGSLDIFRFKEDAVTNVAHEVVSRGSNDRVSNLTIESLPAVQKNRLMDVTV